MSIKRKLTLMTVGISLAAVILTVAPITTYLIYDMRKSKEQSLRVTAAIASDRNSAALAFLDSERVRSNLEIYRLTPSMAAVCLYDANGVLFAAYRNYDTTDARCAQHVQQIRNSYREFLTAFQKVQQSGTTVGYIFMAANTEEINSYVDKIMQISAIVIALVLGVITFLTAYFRRTITDPILELAATAENITANRNYGLEAKSAYPDETGMLARAFNEMLREVRKRDQELTQANETLEEKVTQRTRDLEEAKHKAESASAAKSEFLRNMSHEFRTPLHAIVSFSSYGIKEHETVPPAQLKNYFAMIQKGADRLGRLVNEVLDFSRLEHGAHQFSMQQGDLQEFATRVVELMRPLMEEKRISLKMDFLPEQVVTSFDHDKLTQVITNLLGNAIKFTPEGKTITLRTDKKATEVTLSIIDEGIGIPEGETEMIFESFKQSSRTNTGAGGTGLGLAICKNILKAHHGTIWARNNDTGCGASVSFSIPLAQERQHPNEHAA